MTGMIGIFFKPLASSSTDVLIYAGYLPIAPLHCGHLHIRTTLLTLQYDAVNIQLGEFIEAPIESVRIIGYMQRWTAADASE